MAYYYLISQLPSLDSVNENSPLPISEERFLELCSHHLGKKSFNEIESLSLIPTKQSENSSSELINLWNFRERNLRFALAKIRADKMNKHSEYKDKSLPIELIKIANTATDMYNPLSAEQYLTRCRLEFLESIRPLDAFSEDYIYYFWIKLKLLDRLRKFDTEIGKSEYKNIYDSILNGDGLEVTQ